VRTSVKEEIIITGKKVRNLYVEQYSVVNVRIMMYVLVAKSKKAATVMTTLSAIIMKRIRMKLLE